MYSLSTKNLNKIFAVAKVSYFMKIKSVSADVLIESTKSFVLVPGTYTFRKTNNFVLCFHIHFGVIYFILTCNS
jgi:hypothetical protein